MSNWFTDADVRAASHELIHGSDDSFINELAQLTVDTYLSSLIAAGYAVVPREPEYLTAEEVLVEADAYCARRRARLGGNDFPDVQKPPKTKTTKGSL